MHSLPWSVDYFILYWNKEIVPEEGRRGARRPSRRWSSAAEKLTDPKEGIFGFVGRGLRNANMTLWTNFFLELRRRIPRRQGQHPDRRPGSDRGDEAVSAPADQVRASRRRRLQLDGVDGLLHAGARRPCGSTASAGRRRSRIPNASRVVGKVGYAMVPKGPKGQYSATYGDGIGIAQASKNKEAAYLSANGRCRRRMGARLLQAGGGVPFRNSILNDEGVRSRREDAAGMAAVGHRARRRSASSACRSSSRWPSSATSSAPAITATLSGADPAAELKKATRPVPADPGAQREGVSDDRRERARARVGRPAAASAERSGGRRPTGRSWCRR